MCLLGNPPFKVIFQFCLLVLIALSNGDFCNFVLVDTLQEINFYFVKNQLRRLYKCFCRFLTYDRCVQVLFLEKLKYLPGTGKSPCMRKQ